MPPSSSQGLFAYLQVIPDPRREASTAHPLASLLVVAVCAVICGADSWVAMAAWGRARKPWLTSFLDLPHGIPSHDTFSRVFSLLNPSAFSAAFLAWMQEAVTMSQGAVVAIDGKTLRGSRCKSTQQAAIHLVSAFATANGVVLGQRKTEDKSNEITAIPALLELLALHGCLVTVDAMGCQKAIAAAIVGKEADYLLAVKDNQPALREVVEESVAWGREHGVEALEGSYAQTVEKRTGKVITREAWLVPAPTDLEELAAWKGLRSAVLVQRTVRTSTTEEVGRRLYITSVAATEARRVLEAVREHWRIENQLHWCLDVAFHEDDCRIRAGYAAENMARLRQIATNLLKQERSQKVGIAIKRNLAGWDPDYLLKVLTQ